MTGFIIGAIIGCFIGLSVGACCVAAGREDESVESTVLQEDRRYSGLLEDDE